MSNIRVYTLPNSLPYTNLLIPLSSDNPLNLISKTVENFKFTGNQGKIVVDNVFRAGNSNRRFFELEFKNEKIDFNSLKYVKLDRKSQMRILSNNILQNLPEHINNSILSSAQKRLILKGISI